LPPDVRVTGWARYPAAEAAVTSVASRSACIDAVSAPGRLIARGAGRGYGDCAMNDRIVDMTPLRGIQSFDAQTGVVQCAGGTLLGDIVEACLPHGWFPAVTPGTQFVTVGGAIASDVHGKNHHRVGTFTRHVVRFDLLLGDGQVMDCSRTRNPDLFHATCGGMGLTGMILGAELQLARVASGFVVQRSHRARSLDELLELSAAHGDAAYSVAWIDCVATGARMGRSVLFVGEHATEGSLTPPRRHGRAVPVDLPAWMLNRHSMRAFNALYYRRHASEAPRVVSYEEYFYPLDALRDWYRIYGVRGFLQYQLVLPLESATEGMKAILRRVGASGRASFLCVLKNTGDAGDGVLSFPMKGYSLAMDFKCEAAAFDLLDELDSVVADCGGRIYLAKDARMKPGTFRRGYPRWQAFEAVRARYGAAGKFSSMQSRRLGLQ
jgi:FAD/FMN-containing dehydrogenase